MTIDHQTSRPRPARWEVEQHLLRLVTAGLDQPASSISPEARLLEDLGFDSLAIVELIMGIEAELGIGVPDELARTIFTHPRATLRTVAAGLLEHWDVIPPDRSRGKKGGAPHPEVERVPFTQLGGSVSWTEWLAGELHEPLGLNREGFSQFIRKTDGMRCVAIPAADVVVGCGDADALPDQQPQHRIRVSGFFMDAEPVSCAAYARFLNSVTGVAPETVAEWCGVSPDDHRIPQFPLRRCRKGWEPVPGTETHPMVLVSWYGANAYALWAHRLDWRLYAGERSADSRLPTEAQWEYAARGADYREYPWSAETPTPELAAVARHSLGMEYPSPQLPSAGVHERLGMSPFGLHHMAGNVWQWCRDWYSPDFYAGAAAREGDPVNSTASGVRSERGGSWVGPGELCASSYRRGRPPGARGRCLGFRCAAPYSEVSLSP